MFDHWKQASVQMFGGVDKDVINEFTSIYATVLPCVVRMFNCFYI